MLISKIYLPKSKYAYPKNIFIKIQICLSQKYIYQNPNMRSQKLPSVFLTSSLTQETKYIFLGLTYILKHIF